MTTTLYPPPLLLSPSPSVPPNHTLFCSCPPLISICSPQSPNLTTISFLFIISPKPLPSPTLPSHPSPFLYIPQSLTNSSPSNLTLPSLPSSSPPSPLIPYSSNPYFPLFSYLTIFYPFILITPYPPILTPLYPTFPLILMFCPISQRPPSLSILYFFLTIANPPPLPHQPPFLIYIPKFPPPLPPSRPKKIPPPPSSRFMPPTCPRYILFTISPTYNSTTPTPHSLTQHPHKLIPPYFFLI